MLVLVLVREGGKGGRWMRHGIQARIRPLSRAPEMRSPCPPSTAGTGGSGRKDITGEMGRLRHVSSTKGFKHGNNQVRG